MEMLGKKGHVMISAAWCRRKERPLNEVQLLKEKLHAPLEYVPSWTSRMKSSKDKSDRMQRKKASLNLMEFRYYGCSNNSNNSVINHYSFTGGFYRTHCQK
jgi:hypothetical protein